jgi:hypothetical protein
MEIKRDKEKGEQRYVVYSTFWALTFFAQFYTGKNQFYLSFELKYYNKLNTFKLRRN